MRGANLLRRAAVAAALSCTVLGAHNAMAVPFVFKLNAGDRSVTWYHDSIPTPIQYDYYGLWTHMRPTGSSGGWGEIDRVQYMSPSYYGPNISSVAVFYVNSGWYAFTSPGLYTGTAANPVFHPGVFNLAPNPFVGTPEFSSATTLTIHPVAPAPIAGAGLLAALASLAGFALARPRAFAALGRKLKDRFAAWRFA